MVISESIRIALENLNRHKLRTSLTMLGIIFGVAAVLAMLSIGAGAEKESLSLIQNMGLRNILVQAKSFDTEQLKVVRQDSPGLNRRDGDALRAILPEESVVVGRRELITNQIASRLGRAECRVQGVEAQYPLVMGLGVSSGAFFLPVDDQVANQYCVLGIGARRQLFGTQDPLGEMVKINREWFTVIGVLEDRQAGKDEFEGVKIENHNNDIFIPLGTLLLKYELNPVENELDELVIQLPEQAEIRQQASVISSTMAGLHRNLDDFKLVVPEKLLQQNQKTQRIFNIVMMAIASISLLVGGIGIMNIMLVSVLERTNEIGLRRAMGARRRDISRQFLTESIAICITGSLLGIAFGYGISRLVSAYSGWPTILTSWSLLLGVGVSMTIGMIFGLYPARQAARVSPIVALRHE